MDIRDVATLSGYSVGTVSRVLNGRPNVSDRARERILAVMEECGYEPNSNARFLKMRESSSVAAFVKGAGNRLFGDILEVMQAELAEAGEEVVATYLDEDANEVQEALRYQQIRHPKAMIFLGGEPEYFRASFSRIGVPCVLVTNTADDLAFSNLSSVSIDDVAAAREAIEHLWSFGHRRIGVLGGNRSAGQVSGKRLRGVEEALAAHGVAFDFERDHEPCHFSEEEGYDAVVNLCRRSPDLTAIFALGDVIAFGALRAIYDMGLTVPDDLSLVGFDGTALSQFAVPRLTSVRQTPRHLAERAVKILLRSLAGGSGAVHEVVPYQLLKRESVRQIALASSAD